ncbi:DUF4198 domain-containing protein [Roseospira marina]|uniref:DUF4198 domain-containing protein n=1 Tax=Roseospira marina TaxID=140057 RepID=A0A5M6ICB7_9PROT|nr:DUF4198 domain-containing protein [Roseospira marina]KAA5605617.1 DUF4198 domain-containing protein [Roseospira marina]MBB4313312.1 cobalt/nickel transport protein [Roseospira marina]MBB5085947.1 cobalt/nickel transport protein [Roseospira marina]
MTFRFRAATAALALTSAAAFMLPAAANAHFQLSYTPEVQIDRPGDVPVKLIFWHPFENGHAMDMAKPLDFYMIHRGEKTDLTDRLTPITFQGADNTADAWEATVPVKRAGDYVLVTVPAPYYEESEDIYIQQITKAYLNRGTMPTDWAEAQGLPTEIVPLNKPTNIIAGSTFSGVVLSNGEPVPGAEIEIEYIAAEPDMAANSTTEPTVSPLPGGSVVAVTDADGTFTFGIPKAGYWGFAALGSGPETEHEGKELSQDAVIWIRAYDLK